MTKSIFKIIRLINSITFLQRNAFNQKKFKHNLLLILLSPVMLLFVAGCENSTKVQTVRASEIFGTQITITINGVSEEKAAAAVSESFLHLENMHQRFHAWREGELTIINDAVAANALPLTMSAPMAKMMAQAVDYEKRSGGLFNPAAGKLFAVWGMLADTPPQQLPTVTIASLLPTPTMDEIELSDHTLLSAPSAAQFDFGGFAKGAALDDVRDILRRHGVQDALINIGGNIMALGKNNNKAWRVGLHPVGGVVELADGEAVATSGSSVRFFIVDGRRYHHTLDTRTGEPSVLNTAVSVISDDKQNAGAISDATATALMIADDDEAQLIVRNFALVAALQMRTNGEIRLWGQMEERRH